MFKSFAQVPTAPKRSSSRPLSWSIICILTRGVYLLPTHPGVSFSSLVTLIHLCKHAGTAGLDGIDLGLRVGHSLEAGGKLGTVEVEALARLDGAEGRTGSAADAAGEVARLVQGAVLLCLLAVAGEGLGE